MSFLPKMLFNITLDFVSVNVQCIDSLIGFPEEVGKQIFDRFLIVNEHALLPSDKQVKVIHNFVKAYKNLVLETVQLPEKLILINEYFDSFVELFTNVSELCLCSCYLGDNHELFENIHKFTLLKKLCLRKNCLKDLAIRKITLPIRMFNKGSRNIEYLDLSDNNFTDVIVPWLTAFQNLTYLAITASNLTKKGIETIRKERSLQLYNTENNIHPIFTKGWATPMVDKWNDLHVSRREARKTKEFGSYFKKKRYLIAEGKLNMSSSTKEETSKILTFKRVPHDESCKAINVSSVANKPTLLHKRVFHTETDEDIFSQYIKR